MERALVVVALIGLCSGTGNDTLQCTNPHEKPDCLFACPPQPTCNNRRYALPCVPPTGACTPHCVCADGYARNELGTCITFEQCDKCEYYTEYFSCDGPYAENCQGSCHCASGYQRSANGTCVSTSPAPDTVQPPPPPLESITPTDPPGPPVPIDQVQPIDTPGPIGPVEPIPPIPYIPRLPRVKPVPADLYFYKRPSA